MPKAKQEDDEDLIEEAGQGHNSLSAVELKALVERVEKLIEDRSAVNDDIKAVMEEANAKGFDKRTIREIIKQRSLGQEVREEREALRDMYFAAIGPI